MLTRRGGEDHLGTVVTGTETAASRQRFLRLTAAGAGTLTLGAVLAAGVPRLGLSGTSQSRDVEILNYALVLEELTAAFYLQALARAGLSGELREFAQVVAGHEREHVALLRKALGPNAGNVPRFAFGKAVSSPERFAATAIALEELAVAAYNGQAGNVSKPVLKAAAGIVSVDARHAAWIRAIQDKRPASQATDVAKTRRQVLPRSRPHGIRPELAHAPRPRPARPRRRSSGVGGPRAAGDAQGLPAEHPRRRRGCSAALVLAEPGKAASKTDVDILNYALTLEYLQAAFYTEAERRGALRTPLANETTRVLGAVERAHVRALRDALARLPSQSLSSTSEESRRTRMPSSRRPSRSRIWGRRRTRARRTGSTLPRCWPRRSRSTRWKRGMPPGSGTSPVRPRLPPRSTSRSPCPRCGSSWPRPASSRRSRVRSRRRGRDSPADASSCPRRCSGGARRRRRGRALARRPR